MRFSLALFSMALGIICGLIAGIAIVWATNINISVQVFNDGLDNPPTVYTAGEHATPAEIKNLPNPWLVVLGSSVLGGLLGALGSYLAKLGGLSLARSGADNSDR